MLDGSNEFAFAAAVIVSVVVLLLFPLVLFGQKRRNLASVNLWLCSGIVGILFGVVGTFTVVRAMKYQVARGEDLVAGGQGGMSATSMQGSSPPSEAPAGMKNAKARTKGQDAGGMDDAAKNRMMKGMMQTMGGNAKGTKGDPNAGKKKAGGRGGRGGGGRGGRGGGRGGRGGGANSKRTLTAFVRKLDVLTGDVKIKLSDSQKSELAKLLADIDDRDELDETAAKDALEKLQGVLTDSQKAKQQAVGLPRGGRGGGGRGGRGGGGRGGRGGGGGDDTANPFASETNGKALKSLLSKTGSAKKAPVKKETKKAPPKKAPVKKETKKAPPKKAPVKKAPVKKETKKAPKKAPVKKETKKAPPKKAPPKKAPPKKEAAKKKPAPVKKAPAKKAPAKKK